MGEVLEADADGDAAGLTMEKRADIEEVLSYRSALGFIAEAIAERPLSEHLLRETHALLMRGVRGEDKDPGSYRVDQNWIGAPGCAVEDASYVPIAPEHPSARRGVAEDRLRGWPGVLRLPLGAPAARPQHERLAALLSGAHTPDSRCADLPEPLVPREHACPRLAITVCIEQRELWVAGRVYLHMRKLGAADADQAPWAAVASEEVTRMSLSRPLTCGRADEHEAQD